MGGFCGQLLNARGCLQQYLQTLFNKALEGMQSLVLVLEISKQIQ